MINKQKKLLVTTALTYANGALHLGHMVEQIQCDIWVRYNKLIGHHCTFIGGEDAHGTPIMLSAAKQNITPEQLIAKCYAEHFDDLTNFYINYDNFYTTHSEENKAMTSLVFNKLKENGDIVRKEMAIRSKLIEHVAKRIYDRVIRAFPKLIETKVKVTKLLPPMNGPVDKVSVIIED